MGFMPHLPGKAILFFKVAYARVAFGWPWVPFFSTFWGHRCARFPPKVMNPHYKGTPPINQLGVYYSGVNIKAKQPTKDADPVFPWKSTGHLSCMGGARIAWHRPNFLGGGKKRGAVEKKWVCQLLEACYLWAFKGKPEGKR